MMRQTLYCCLLQVVAATQSTPLPLEAKAAVARLGTQLRQLADSQPVAFDSAEEVCGSSVAAKILGSPVAYHHQALIPCHTWHACPVLRPACTLYAGIPVRTDVWHEPGAKGQWQLGHHAHLYGSLPAGGTGSGCAATGGEREQLRRPPDQLRAAPKLSWNDGACMTACRFIRHSLTGASPC